MRVICDWCGIEIGSTPTSDRVERVTCADCAKKIHDGVNPAKPLPPPTDRLCDLSREKAYFPCEFADPPQLERRESWRR